MKLEQSKNKRQKTIILQKAGELFWQKGYEKTSLKAVAEKCGFAAPNIYHYFKNKENVLYEVLHEEMERGICIVKQSQKPNVQSASDRLRNFIKANVRHTLGRQRSSSLLFDTELKNLSPKHLQRIIKMRDDYDSVLRSIIQYGIKNGEFAYCDERVVSFSISSMIVRLRIWYSPKGKLSRDKIASILTDFVLSGLNTR